MQFDHMTCGQIVRVTRIRHFMQIMWLLFTKKSGFLEYIWRFLEIKLGFLDIFGELTDRFLGHFSGFLYLGLGRDI